MGRFVNIIEIAPIVTLGGVGAAALVEQGSKAQNSLGRKTKRPREGAFSFSGGGASPLRRTLSGILPRLSPESSPECDVTIYANRESRIY